MEIDDARRRLESDLIELEERLPVPLRSAKSVAGVLFGTAFAAVLARRLLSGRSERKPAAEVVVRVVHENGKG
jgi:hypothetical protein